METPLTQNIRPNEEPLDLAGYRKTGGYETVERTVGKTDPQSVTKMVKDSGLRGRGGAGFPTGTKWSFVPMGEDAPRPKYLCVNADEMEPGTFKDRYLMEGDPHQLLEGVILSAYAIGAEVAYIFLRWAYHPSERRLRKAIAEAREAGLIGENVCGSGWNLEVYIHVSAGRYMCGEETGLLNALEGKRATPRDKPPYPAVSGLFGKPTAVNNVETICCVPHIVAKGPEWFRGLAATDQGAGSKLYGASGKVRRPGIWEMPIGAPLGAVLDRAGGMREGLHFKGALPGGASTGFLTNDHLDVPLDFDTVEKVGSRLGTGTLIVLDDRTCPVGMVHNLEVFFAQESCGWCTPCREGLPWTAKTLAAIEAGQGRPEDLEILAMHGRLLGPGHTFCALAPGAAMPLQTALEHFEGDFQRHIQQGRCPWREA